MTSKPVRFGVIGCGVIAYWYHLRELRTLPGARLVAVAESDAAARERAHQLTGAVAFRDAEELLGRGVEVSEPFHGAADTHAGRDAPYISGTLRVSGPDRERRSYRSFASFGDPDGNGWLLQEITGRLPGRVEGDTTFASIADLAATLRRAAIAHGEHEKRAAGRHDENWPDWYAEYIVNEQAGRPLRQ